jgi:uncharacterized membrane protein YdjX (TVP38/TMEM64 family)
MTRDKKNRLLAKGGIFALLIALIFLLSWYGPQPFSALGPWGENLGKIYTRKRRLARFLTSFGPYSAAIFMLLQALQVVISPIPGELTGVVGGYVYGVGFGFLFSTVGLTLGSWIAFELATLFGKPLVERFVPEKVLERFHFLTTNAGAIICFLLFVIPGFPKDYLCYMLGLTGMNLSTFLIVSTVGRMPGTYLLTVQGASIGHGQYQTAIIIAAISGVVVLAAYIYRVQLYRWIKGFREKDIPT